MSYLFMFGWVLMKFLFWIAAIFILIDSFAIHYAYRALSKEYDSLFNKYKLKCLETEAIKQIYQGCTKAERTTGKQIDFDGKIEIISTNVEDAYEQTRGNNNGSK